MCSKMVKLLHVRLAAFYMLDQLLVLVVVTLAVIFHLCVVLRYFMLRCGGAVNPNEAFGGVVRGFLVVP
jgi:hypothetical protein